MRVSGNGSRPGFFLLRFSVASRYQLKLLAVNRMPCAVVMRCKGTFACAWTSVASIAKRVGEGVDWAVTGKHKLHTTLAANR